jgi:glucose-6-phosphate-specific signal transduction histidine kinase
VPASSTVVDAAVVLCAACGRHGRLTLDQLDRTDLGPKQIRERVRAMHGGLTIKSEPGTGANIVVDWPRGAYV